MVTKNDTSPTKTTTVSFKMKKSLHDRWQRSPRYAKRSKILNRLVEMYLNNQVNVVLSK